MKETKALSSNAGVMKKPLLSPLLLLVSLVPLLNVFGFIAPAVVRDSSSSRSNSKRFISGWRRRSSPTSVSHHAAVGTRSSLTASATLDSGSVAGFPAVVVSFGLTEQERLAAEEAVFLEGHLFPSGVRILDGSQGSGRTLREVCVRDRVGISSSFCMPL